MITYEYPLNERIRTLLRLEDLFERSRHFLARTDPLDHHVALLTLFEILEVAEPRRPEVRPAAGAGAAEAGAAVLPQQPGNLRGGAQRGAARHRAGGRGAVLHDRQDRPVPARERMADVDQAAHRHSRRRLRIRPALLPLLAAPAGRGAHRPARRLDQPAAIRCATAPRSSCASCARAASRSALSAPQGTFQQMLGGKTAQMVRVRLDPALHCVPEISANKYVLNIRFLAQNGEDPRATHRRLGRRLRADLLQPVTATAWSAARAAARRRRCAPENRWRPFCCERCKTDRPGRLGDRELPRARRRRVADEPDDAARPATAASVPAAADHGDAVRAARARRVSRSARCMPPSA